jgi:hypothetical protein
MGFFFQDKHNYLLFGCVKGNCCFLTLLIGAEGEKTPAGERGWGDPTGA